MFNYLLVTDRSNIEKYYPQANWLLGRPNNIGDEALDGETEVRLEPWQVPLFEVAVNGLLRVARDQGAGSPSEDWAPSPVEGAALYRELAPERKLLGMINSLRQYRKDVTESRIVSPLRDSQELVIDAVERFLTDPSAGFRGYIKKPTGSGKTAIFTSLVAMLKHEENPREPVRTLVLAPKKDIVVQILGEDGKRGFGRFASHLEVGAYFQDRKELDKPTTVMTYQSFGRLVDEGVIKGGDYDVVIADELHKASGALTAKKLRNFLEGDQSGQPKIAIGLSATPKDVEGLFTHEIYSMGLREAIGDGLLAPVRARVRQTEIVLDEQISHENRHDFANEELEGLIGQEGRNQLIVQEAVAQIEEGRQTIIRCVPGANLRHARLIRNRLHGQNATITDSQGNISKAAIRAEIVTGDMSQKERAAIYAAFERRQVQAITFVGVLTEGWDSDVAKCLINACPSKSPDEIEQVLGRILRPYEDPNGKVIVAEAIDIVDRARAKIITCVDILGRDRPYLPGKIAGLEDDEIDAEIMARKPRSTKGGERDIEEPDVKALIRAVGSRTLDEVVLGQAQAELEPGGNFNSDGGDIPISITEAAIALGVERYVIDQYLKRHGFADNLPVAIVNGRRMRHIPQEIVDRIAADLINRDAPIV